MDHGGNAKASELSAYLDARGAGQYLKVQMPARIVRGWAGSGFLDSVVSMLAAVIALLSQRRRVGLKGLLKSLPALVGRQFPIAGSIHHPNQALPVPSSLVSIHRTCNPRAASCRLRSQDLGAFPRLTKLVALLSSLRSRHREVSELVGRGSLSVGGLVCAGMRLVM